MKLAGRLQAAIDIFEILSTRPQPVANALKDWGAANRYAGSSDRGVIGNLVYDGLRMKSSVAWQMGAETSRALGLGVLRFGWKLTADQIAALCDGSKYAPAVLSEQELNALQTGSLDGAPAHVLGDYPDWLDAALKQGLGDQCAVEMAALAHRAPIDLRVNLLKATPEKVLKELARYHPEAPGGAATCVRIASGVGEARAPAISAEPGFHKGWFEIQDLGSQLAVQFARAEPGMQVLDLCAGAGGKTLALAAEMNNKGQIHAYDCDRYRLANIWARLKRAGVRNVQVLRAGDEAALEPLRDHMDMVLADVPCSGSGSWRRRPDGKWRLRETSLAARLREQAGLLIRARDFVKPGGRLVYVSCSLLACENGQQIESFLRQHDDFVICSDFATDPLFDPARHGVWLSPLRSGSDGYFVAVLRRVSV